MTTTILDILFVCAAVGLVVLCMICTAYAVAISCAVRPASRKTKVDSQGAPLRMPHER